MATPRPIKPNAIKSQPQRLCSMRAASNRIVHQAPPVLNSTHNGIRCCPREKLGTLPLERWSCAQPKEFLRYRNRPFLAAVPPHHRIPIASHDQERRLESRLTSTGAT